MSDQNQTQSWKRKLHEIIYEADTPAGKLFDVVLLLFIILSIILVMLESVDYIGTTYFTILDTLEWIITILFTLEYIARIVCVKNPKAYIFSFYGIVDFLSTIPKYLSLFVVGTHSLVAIRALRLLRVFRILKLTRYIGESTNFGRALKRSRVKVAVFLSFVLVLCVILGTVMYLVEGDKDSGFTSIPRSVYWAIVTLTTVGYGDIAPISSLGQFIASLIMILGYGIIAIPTGIVTSEMTRSERKSIPKNTHSCTNCMESYHADNAKFCHKCGQQIDHE
ncbi:MAG: ion transporter [Flavobacteriaceae bacterium]|jgi:voltage-gated potassium channel|nr:ion transporter [Flavobacteriaceae bacterium]